MANSPTTLTFGPWAPDLSSQGVPVIWTVPSLGAVPCVDVLNVRYQDSNWICCESPVVAGPSLADMAVGAFTWYDNTGSQEIVFAASADGISALIDGAWVSVPTENFVSVTARGFSSFSRMAAMTQARGFSSTTKVGTVTTSLSGFVYDGTLTQGSASGGLLVGYGTGYGSMSPSNDTRGNQILTLAAAPTASQLSLQIGKGNLGQTYFTTITITGPSSTLSLSASAATYNTDGSTESTWRWSGSVNPFGTNPAGTTYHVRLQ